VARPTVVGRLLIPQNKPPPRLCYHVRFGTSATKSAYALIEGNPHNGERCDLAHLGVGHVADRLKQALSQMCYRVKFDCWFCMRQMVDAWIEGISQNWGALTGPLPIAVGLGVVYPLEIHTLSYSAEFGRSRSNGRKVISTWKIWPIASSLWRSIAQGYRNLTEGSATCDLHGKPWAYFVPFQR